MNTEERIRFDITNKTVGDVIAVIERNCNLLTIEGRSYDGVAKLAFVLTITTSVLTSTFILLREIGLKEKALNNLLELAVKSMQESIATHAHEYDQKQEREKV